jgi:hypothetical protein
MPKTKSTADVRSSELRKMAGTDFALEVTKDLVLLAKDERSKAIRMLTALNQTIDRESEALAAK